MEIKTSNVIAQRLDDLSHFFEYDNKKWVAVDDLIERVEQLKTELKENMIYLHRGDKTYLFKQIDKAFEDIIEKH